MKPVLGNDKNIQRPVKPYLDSSFYMFVSVDGSIPITFTWYKNDTLISRATNDTLYFNALAASDAGKYYCIVNNNWGCDTTAVETVTVQGAPVAPKISVHPQLQEVVQGQSASFGVSATGTAPLSYQWQKNGSNISGATDSTYTTPATTMADSGALFRCIVSNTAGADTSDNALLQVSKNSITPTVTVQPLHQTVTECEKATFSITATGTIPLNYQWKKNGSNISGATSSDYTTPATIMTDSGSIFRCIVSNIAGADTSDNALLVVNKIPIKPTFIMHPQSDTALVGASIDFTVSSTGTSPITFQWQKNGNDISGETSTTYSIPPSTKVDNGAVCRCVASNSVGRDTSDEATLTVYWAPEITKQPQSDTVVVSDPVTFSVIANGNPSLACQWKKGGVNIFGATSSSYTIASVQTINAGSYTVDVTNAVSTVTSSTAILTVYRAPEIATQPQSQTIKTGDLVTFSVDATGNPAPTYQWQKGGVDINGATNKTYQIPSVQASDAENYTANIMNIVDTITSNIAVLTVYTAPVISANPKDTTVVKDNPVSFTVVASGNPSPTYQWKKDGAVIPGQTNSTYLIASAQTTHAGSYSVDVMNSVDTVHSSVAILTVYTAPTISTDPKDSTVVLGSPVSFTVVASGIPSPTYQWKKNVVAISGQTNSICQIPSTQKSDAANYTVDVMNIVDTVTSNIALLTVQYTPVITTQPQSATVRVCDTITFTVSADCIPAPSYQWVHNGSDITGATDTSYTVNSIEPNDGGNYSVRVWNSVNTINSLEATLTVNMGFLDLRDNQVYKVVQIGNQIWMAQNLNYEPSVGDTMDYSCYNKYVDYCEDYGRLYSWELAMCISPDVQICPAGWHLPGKIEFETLITFAGGNSVAGGKLKDSDDWDGTDDYGFNALPAGYNFFGLYTDLDDGTYFWTSTEYTGGGRDEAYYISLATGANGAGLNYTEHKMDGGSGYYLRLGHSVRCVKD